MILARRPADDDKSGVTAGGNALCQSRGDRHLLLMPGLVRPARAALKGVISQPFSVDIQQLPVQRKIRSLLYGFLYSDCIDRIHHSPGACARFVIVELAPAKKRDVRPLIKGQRSLVIFQKDKSFCRCLPGSALILFHIPFQIFPCHPVSFLRLPQRTEKRYVVFAL